MFIHAGLLPCLFDFWYITKDCFHTFEDGVLKINKCLTCLPSYRMLLSSRSLNKLIFVLLKSRALLLLFVLLPSLRVWNCTTSHSLQTRLSLTSTNSLFVSNKLESSLACFLPKPSTVSQTILFTVWELRVLLELFPVDGFHAAALFSTVRVYWSRAQWS